ncbi:MAG: leucine-rich repeat domain-containing protein, partial [Muribaculaceae bacterium]|nr:leucine-rich repeat domain-containing protein [Muribaculaceae bacterium]
MKHLTIAIISFLLISFDAIASYDFKNKIEIGDLTYCFDDDNKEAQVVDCSNSVQSISIPSTVRYGLSYSVVEIDGLAFYGCSSLTSVTIPSSVTKIGHNAFGSCSSLTSIEIPNSVTMIGNGAFHDCLSLTSFTIPNSVTEIGVNVFEGCTSLKNLIIEDGFEMLDNKGAFRGFPLETLYWGRNFRDTPKNEGGFSLIETLTSVTISNSVTTILASTFEGCVGLTSVEIPHSITTIGRSAFNMCSSLTSLSIPNSVTFIGDYVFGDCSNLKDLIFEDGDKDLLISRIYDLNSLENLYIGRLGTYQFDRLNAIESVTIG